jgi:hypothetical protein
MGFLIGSVLHDRKHYWFIRRARCNVHALPFPDLLKRKETSWWVAQGWSIPPGMGRELLAARSIFWIRHYSFLFQFSNWHIAVGCRCPRHVLHAFAFGLFCECTTVQHCEVKKRGKRFNKLLKHSSMDMPWWIWPGLHWQWRTDALFIVYESDRIKDEICVPIDCAHNLLRVIE